MMLLQPILTCPAGALREEASPCFADTAIPAPFGAAVLRPPQL